VGVFHSHTWLLKKGERETMEREKVAAALRDLASIVMEPPDRRPVVFQIVEKHAGEQHVWLDHTAQAIEAIASITLHYTAWLDQDERK
jgi:hypothetical protein